MLHAREQNTWLREKVVKIGGGGNICNTYYENENLRIFPCAKTVIKSYLTVSSNDIHFN